MKRTQLKLFSFGTKLALLSASLFCIVLSSEAQTPSRQRLSDPNRITTPNRPPAITFLEPRLTLCSEEDAVASLPETLRCLEGEMQLGANGTVICYACAVLCINAKGSRYSSIGNYCVSVSSN